MSHKRIEVSIDQLNPFQRQAFGTGHDLTYIGDGAIGGKASGLAFIRNALAEHFPDNGRDGIAVNIPYLTVIASGMFDRFIDRNRLYDLPFDELRDDRIAYAFQNADLPTELLGDLRALITTVHTPLAVRSSSRLEDAMYEPFAGVYATKMIPNNQHHGDTRFRKLVEAIKYVYASMFFKGARDYLRSTGQTVADEKMAVIIQEVVGQRFHDRFYPDLSGVSRSFNFYPVGNARPADGVVNLALGLGKTIVDGGTVWCYSPKFPRAVPPVSSPSELLEKTQKDFWAVNMAKPRVYDPIRETEYLIRGDLAEAEFDGTLSLVASTYRAQDDRIVMGIGHPGPRLLNFEPILDGQDIPLNNLLKQLMQVCESTLGCEVETEFAVTFHSRTGLPARLGFLQVRAMAVSHARVEISDEELSAVGNLVASTAVMGNGVSESISDIIYVRPDNFNAADTRLIARDLATFNNQMLEQGKHYLLIGFGRWGSSDPWLGIPVYWGQVSAARAFVEATLPSMIVELSQGSHFFHNLCSFQVSYFSVLHEGSDRINWDWLKNQPETGSTRFVRHVRTNRPLTIKVDGQTGRGLISV